LEFVEESKTHISCQMASMESAAHNTVRPASSHSKFLLQYSHRPYVRSTYSATHYLPKHTEIRPQGTAYFQSHSQGNYCQLL